MKKFLTINGTFLLPDNFKGNRTEALRLLVENFAKTVNDNNIIANQLSPLKMLEYKDKQLSFETNSYEDSMANFHGYVGLFTSNENKIKIVAYKIRELVEEDFKSTLILILTKNDDTFYCENRCGYITIGTEEFSEKYYYVGESSYNGGLDNRLPLQELINSTSDIFDFSDAIDIGKYIKAYPSNY